MPRCCRQNTVGGPPFCARLQRLLDAGEELNHSKVFRPYATLSAIAHLGGRGSSVGKKIIERVARTRAGRNDDPEGPQASKPNISLPGPLLS